MKIVVLGSSSSGNSTYFEFGNKKFLVDVGLGFSMMPLCSKKEPTIVKLEPVPDREPAAVAELVWAAVRDQVAVRVPESARVKVISGWTDVR